MLAVAGGLRAIFMPEILPASALLIAGFLMQALWDVTSVEAGRLPRWFGKLRMILTAGAVVSLIATLVASAHLTCAAGKAVNGAWLPSIHT